MTWNLAVSVQIWPTFATKFVDWVSKAARMCRFFHAIPRGSKNVVTGDQGGGGETSTIFPGEGWKGRERKNGSYFFPMAKEGRAETRKLFFRRCYSTRYCVKRVPLHKESIFTINSTFSTSKMAIKFD